MKKKILKSKESGHLVDLVIGQKARVTGLHNDNKAVRRRLLDMGITTNAIVSIKKIAPLGDPVSIELRGYELCLRKKDIALIDIEVL